MRSTRSHFALLVPLALLLLSSCALPAPQPAADVQIANAQNAEISTARRGDVLILDVHSETGIGSAQVGVPATPPLRDMILRLHLRGLEELKFTYAAGAIVVSVPSSGEPIVRQTFTPAGQSAAQAITRGSPYWMNVGILSNDAATPTIPLANGHFDVSAPADYLAGKNLDFVLSWIDFYR